MTPKNKYLLDLNKTENVFIDREYATPCDSRSRQALNSDMNYQNGGIHKNFKRSLLNNKLTFKIAEQQMLAVKYMRKVSFFRKARGLKREFVKFAVLGTKIFL